MKGILRVIKSYVEVEIKDGAIVGCEFCEANDVDLKDDPMLIELQRQFDEYTHFTRHAFDIPLHLEGTDFQKKVWDALCTIPFGQVRSYKQIAEQIGEPKAYRAVGGACNKNPIGVIIPCHRVVGSNGKLTGYAGGLELKQFLLNHEDTINKHA